MIRDLWQALRGTDMQSAARPDALASQPINPDWVREGKPEARATLLTQTNKARAGVWECTAGKFDWTFDVDETVFILEGEVHVESEGKTQVLAAGSTAFFPCGLTTRWFVPKYVKKFFTHHLPGRVHQMAARVGSLVRKTLMIFVALLMSPELLEASAATAACL